MLVRKNFQLYNKSFLNKVLMGEDQQFHFIFVIQAYFYYLSFDEKRSVICMPLF